MADGQPRPAAGVAVLDEVAGRLGASARRNVAMSEHTTYRVGGPAAVFVEATTVEDLASVAEAVEGTEVPILVVGRGSNLLVADAGFAGVVVALGGDFEAIDIADTTVTAGGAAALPVVARRTAAAGLRGFEWAVGVPGSVGGAVRMNAGGHGADMAASLVGVRLFGLRGGEDVEVAPDALHLAYRSSSVADDEVVVWARLGLQHGDRAAAEAEIAGIVAWRREHQPGGANAGSVFTNPPGDAAGRLIDSAGCRGLRVGSAAVSDRHANFIQADAGGSADDVRALMDVVRNRVKEAHGVTLVTETRLAGFVGTLGGPPSGSGPAGGAAS